MHYVTGLPIQPFLHHRRRRRRRCHHRYHHHHQRLVYIPLFRYESWRGRAVGYPYLCVRVSAKQPPESYRPAGMAQTPLSRFRNSLVNDFPRFGSCRFAKNDARRTTAASRLVARSLYLHRVWKGRAAFVIRITRDYVNFYVVAR